MAAKGKKLARGVVVRDEDGNTHSFNAGDDVPGDLAKLVTNPTAWEDGAEDDEVVLDDKEGNESNPPGVAYTDGYTTMKVADLLRLAQERKIDLKGQSRKDDVVEALREADGPVTADEQELEDDDEDV